MKHKVLITGGSGFIGSNLLEYLLLQSKYELVNLDINAPENNNNFLYWKKIDLLNSSVLADFVSEFQPEYIIHLAARTDLNGKTEDDYSVNTEGAKAIIKSALNVSSVKKIIFASSMLVCRVGYIPKSDTDYAPPNVYGESKVQMEKIIRSGSYPWQWTIVRPTSIWGPGFKEPYRNFFDVVAKGRFLDIGARYCSKTYGYIENAVYQIHEILKSPDTSGKTYYLGDAPPIFVSDWAKEISKAMNLPEPRKIPFEVLKIAAKIGDVLKKVNVSLPMTSFRLKNMTTNNILDLSDLYKIAPNPPCTRQEGIAKTIDWLKNEENK